jgi:predicted  nucleic acid-binding Zn-ribbon protein
MRSRIAELTNQILGNTYAIELTSGATVFWTKTQIEAAVAAGTLEVATANQALAAGKATFAVRGLSVALRIMTALTVVGFIVTLGAVLLGAAQSAGLFSRAINRNEDDLKDLGKEALSASGGLQALLDTTSAGASDSGYKTLTRTVGELTEEEKKLNVELEKVRDASDAATSAFIDSSEAQKQYGDNVRDTNDALQEQLTLTPESGTVIINALGNFTYEDEDGQITSFFMEQIRNPEIAAAAKLLGFDIGEAANAGLSQDSSATEYFAKFKTAFDQLGALVNESHLTGPDGLANSFEHIGEIVGLSAEEVETAFNIMKNSPDIDFSSFQNGIDLIDGYILASREAYQANEAIRMAGGLVDDDGNELKSKTELIKIHLDTVGLLAKVNQDAQASFQNLANGIIGTRGSLEGLDTASKTNLENFNSYIVSAFAAAEVSGEGAEGALLNVARGISSLGAQGVNTGEMLERFAEVAITALPGVGAEYKQMLSDIAAAPDLKGMEKIIIAFYKLKIAAADSAADAGVFVTALQRALRGLNESSKEFDITGPVTQSMTALEKLTESLDSLFSWTAQQTGISGSLRTLGKSLEENGNTFSIWSEAGESNVNNIEGVIRQLATRSGGNLQTFANLLASLRQSLVDAGVGASGLRYVDIAIENTGKTGKATDSIVKRLTNSLEDIDSSVDEIKTVEEAIKAVADAASKGIKSNFSEAYAIDEVTLGWLDMADAAEDAAESIVNFQEDIDKANESIEDATQSIIEAKAAIDGLTADRGKLEYQLEVALRYGDFLRADQIRADIAKVDADLLGEADNISDANKDISKSQKDVADAEQGIIDVRTESTREAIEASRALEDMAEKYALVTAGMIINAAEGEDLIAIIDAQVEAFKENAIQMGYTETKAQAVADVLRKELIKSMDEIPENIETDIVADTDEALSNVLSFVSKANTALALIKDRTVTTTFVEKRVGYKTSSNPNHWDGYSDGGIVRGAGTGTSDSIAARLSNGEFVVNASAVQHFGVPFMNALNQSKLPAASMSAPNQQGQGSQMVYLSPEDRQLLRSAVERPISLYTDNTVIAKSANAGNQVLAQRGSN